MASTGHCYHCALPIPAGTHWHRVLDGEERAFCCPACQSVAEIIHQDGLDDYYRLRETPGNRPSPDADGEHPFDNAIFAQQLLQQDDHGHCRARFAVEGLHCAACAWLIESRLSQLPGLATANVSLNDQSLSVEWDARQLSAGQIARRVEQLGYGLSPWHPEAVLALQQREYRASLLRLGVAGIAMMQTGILAIALYLGDYQDIEPQWRELLRWVSLLFALPVATFSAWPFYRNAFNGLRHGETVMDLPVSLAIGGAFIASCAATVWQHEHVYFDSVVMFTFFLLTGRHLEMVLRHRNRRDSLVDHQALPWQACRLDTDHDHREERIPAMLVRAGDRILVKPGEAVPVDGLIHEGRSALNESVLTGESLPVLRGPGEAVLAGSTNTEQALVIVAAGSQAESRIARMHQQLSQALSSKPAFAILADRLASRFVMVVIAAAAVTYWYSLPLGFETALTRVLAVLVASCPCALSLATPSALAAASHALAKAGYLVTRAHVLETLPAITRIVFDKTGTLTEGRLSISEVICTDRLGREDALSIAAALEQHSNHPVARAFTAVRSVSAHDVIASDIQQHPGMGVSGRIGQALYHLGHGDFLGIDPPDQERHWVGLSDAEGLLAWFALQDRLRDDAASTIAALREKGFAIELLTGDRSGEALRIGQALGIDRITAGSSPQAKQSHILHLQQQGERVLMVGDGVNDAAVLATADVSVAVADATSLARLQADAILTRPALALLLTAHQQALATRRIIRENLAWAAGYNATVIPLAAMGWIPPWLAAIGMSSSSLLVIGNAMRLSRMR